MENDLVYQLAPTFRSALAGDHLLLGFGSFQNSVKSPSLQVAVLALARQFRAAQPCAEAVKQVISEKGIVKAEADVALALLKHGRYIVPVDTHDRTSRYSRPGLYYNLLGKNPNHAQSIIAKSKVVILGCGGVGNVVATYLATAGIGQMVLVDADEIELSNLTRQIMFTEEDVGKKKVDVLEERISERHPATKISKLDTFLVTPEELDTLPDFDFLVLSADRPNQLVYNVNRLCLKRRRAFINVAYVFDGAVWGPLVVPGETGCFECQELVKRDQSQDSWLNETIELLNKDFQPPSTGPINCLAAGGGVADAIKYLIGCQDIASKNKRIILNTSDMSITKYDASRNPNCKQCSKL